MNNPETGDRNHRHQGFRQFCKVADIFVKALDVTFFWRRKAPFECLKRKAPRGVWRHAPEEMFKKEHSETLFPASLKTKYQFPRQSWSSFKFSLKSKIFNENRQMVGDGGGGKATTEFSVVYHCEFTFYKIKKKT